MVETVLAQVNTDRADDPIGLLFAISLSLFLLAVLVAGLFSLYFRATRPRRRRPRTDGEVHVTDPAPPPAQPLADEGRGERARADDDGDGDGESPAGGGGDPVEPPPRRRSPVL